MVRTYGWQHSRATDDRVVRKRDVAAILWFLAGWSGGGLAAGLLGAPSVLGFVPGIILAVLVRWDPTHLIWPAAESGARRVRPMKELADELDKGASQRASSDGDHARV